MTSSRLRALLGWNFGREQNGRDGSAPTWAVGDVENGVDAVGTLVHDVQAVVVFLGRRVSDTVVLDADLREGWFHPAGDPQVGRLRVLSCVRDRLLRNAQ